MTTRSIGEAADEAGVSTDTLRYYERVGLLPPAGRTAGGYRRYGPGITARVRLIKGAQRLGLRLNDIKELLDIRDRGACPCGHTRRLLEERLHDLDDQRRHLDELRGDLTTMLADLDDCPEPAPGNWRCETVFARKGGEPR